jgi:hypothetical protein
MNKRPTSVTVVCWIMIVLSGISLITSTMTMDDPTAKELMSRSPIPITIQYIMMYAAILVMLISGIAMLRGQNWARFLYVIWSVIGFAIGLATSPMKLVMIPGIVVFIVIAFFLFRSKANEYFRARGAEIVSSGTQSL